MVYQSPSTVNPELRPSAAPAHPRPLSSRVLIKDCSPLELRRVGLRAFRVQGLIITLNPKPSYDLGFHALGAVGFRVIPTIELASMVRFAMFVREC